MSDTLKCWRGTHQLPSYCAFCSCRFRQWPPLALPGYQCRRLGTLSCPLHSKNLKSSLHSSESLPAPMSRMWWLQQSGFLTAWNTELSVVCGLTGSMVTTQLNLVCVVNSSTVTTYFWMYRVDVLLLGVSCGRVYSGCIVWTCYFWMYRVDVLLLDVSCGRVTSGVTCGRVTSGCIVWTCYFWMYRVDVLLLGVSCGRVTSGCIVRTC